MIKTDTSLWPSLAYEEWSSTCETVHMWTQIIGKVKLELCSPENHWWHVALNVTPLGLTTGPIPYELITFQVDFDFVSHQLKVVTSTAKTETIKLEAKSVRTFYFEFIEALSRLDISVNIDTLPREVANPIRFDEDTIHSSYDATAVENFRNVLIQCDQVFREFRGRFCGKSSPVLFYWGGFDLAETRFSGRMYEKQNADGSVAEYAEEHSMGFWPGSENNPKAVFYAYALPPPDGYYQSGIEPEGAYYDEKLGEFVLEYDRVRTMPNPSQAILAFVQRTYEAAADLAKWDRDKLERVILEPIPN
jgi:Family of unknown function (DUF5996)